MSAILGNGTVTFGDSTVQTTSGVLGQVFTESGTFTIPDVVTAYGTT